MKPNANSKVRWGLLFGIVAMLYFAPASVCAAGIQFDYTVKAIGTITTTVEEPVFSEGPPYSHTSLFEAFVTSSGYQVYASPAFTVYRENPNPFNAPAWTSRSRLDSVYWSRQYGAGREEVTALFYPLGPPLSSAANGSWNLGLYSGQDDVLSRIINVKEARSVNIPMAGLDGDFVVLEGYNTVTVTESWISEIRTRTTADRAWHPEIGPGAILFETGVIAVLQSDAIAAGAIITAYHIESESPAALIAVTVESGVVRIAAVETAQVMPYPPELISPVGGVETTNVFPVLTWRHRSPANLPQGAVHVQIAFDSQFAAVLFETAAVGGTTTIRIPAAVAAPADSMYYWRVQTSNAGESYSEYSFAETFSFENLLADPSLEEWEGGAVGDGMARWNKLNSTTSNHVRQTSTTVLSGRKALQLQSPTTAYARGIETDTGDYRISAESGIWYRAGGWARKNNVQLTPDAYQVRFQIDWRGSSGELISSSTYEDTFEAFDLWQSFVSETWATPPGATRAQLRVQVKRTGGTAQSGDHIYVDDLYFTGETAITVQSPEDTSLIGRVAINEIMWTPGEYVELANPTTETVAIGGWRLLATGTPEFTIPAGAMIPAGGFYLIAETGAVTVAPDQVAAIDLAGGGEVLQLTTAGGMTIDEANRVGP